MTQDERVSTDPRTGLVELSTAECWELLEANGTGRVAVSVGTTPDIFPVSYLVRDGEIVIRTEAGTKSRWLAITPREVTGRRIP